MIRINNEEAIHKRATCHRVVEEGSNTKSFCVLSNAKDGSACRISKNTTNFIAAPMVVK